MRARSIAGWLALVAAVAIVVFLLTCGEETAPPVASPRSVRTPEMPTSPERRPGSPRAGSERTQPETADEAGSANVIAKDPSGRIEGQVLDEAGSPIEGVELRLVPRLTPGPRGGEADSWEPRVTASAGDGTFAFDDMPLVTAAVLAWHPKFVLAQSSEVVVAVERAARVELRQKHGLTIAGRVVRDDAEPLGNLELIVETEGNVDAPLPPGRALAVDPDGRFRVECLQGARYQLNVIGFRSGGCDPVEAQAGDLDVVLTIRHEEPDDAVASSISGTVRLSGARTLEGAWVRARRTDGASPEKFGREGELTDTAGSFRIDGLTAGTYELLVSSHVAAELLGKPNIRSSRVRDVAAGTEGLVVDVEPGLSISGTVRLPKVARVQFGYAIATSGPESKEILVSSEISDGRFELIGLEPGCVCVTVEVDRCLPCVIEVEAGTRDVLVELVSPGAIRGRVEFPDGRPARNAWVRIADEGGRRDAVCGAFAGDEGRFELRDVAPGDHRLVADFDDRPGGESFRGEAIAIGVKSGATVESVTIRMTRLP